MWRAALMFVVACSAPARRMPPPAPAPSVGPTARITVRAAPPPVRWANITTVDGCFYFSGPFNGRDETLRGAAEVSTEGTRATFRLGEAVFEGTFDGESLDVRRTLTREYEGAWTVTETIAGSYRAESGELRAHYHYEECGQEGCPGRCTMTADFSGPLTVRQ